MPSRTQRFARAYIQAGRSKPQASIEKVKDTWTVEIQGYGKVIENGPATLALAVAQTAEERGQVVTIAYNGKTVSLAEVLATRPHSTEGTD